ncbi:MAG: hypothetical protein JSV41_13570 [Gemmatimonadota bacterium]|nr:MAG: hypothetical protein JSV41_13570 [Gemmatimonadota bacterium]
MRARTLALACALVPLLAGCEDEEASGIVVGPLAGPRVAESVLALAVVDGVPVGITTIFEQGEVVNLWVHWEALQPPHVAEAVWFDAFADDVDATTLEIRGRAAEQVTVFSLELTSFSQTGRWGVELYLDGELQRSHAFHVVEAVPGE